MPSGIVKTPEDEKAWEDAKRIVREQYPGREESDSDSFYALVTTVFKSVQKGRKKKAKEEVEESQVDWRAALAFVAPVHEDRFDVKTEAAKLEPGTHVVVTTKLGRTMAEGVVIDADAKKVHVRTSRDSIDQDRVFSTDLYNFFVKKTDEADVLDEARRRGRSSAKALHDKIMAKYKGGPAIDKREYPPIRGMEGPFRFRKSGILYYDPREGAYYDSKKDMYLPKDQMVEMAEEYEVEAGVVEAVLKHAGYDKDFKAGFAKGQEVLKKNPKADSTDGAAHYRRVSKKHGSYWLDGFNAAVDVARGATKTGNAKVAAKLGLVEAAEVDIRRDIPDDPENSDTTGPLPVRPPPEDDNRVGTEYVRVAVGGDRRRAEEVWQDILSIGFTRAMERHGLPDSAAVALQSTLVSLGLINQESPGLTVRG
jgi:hypothetical protein